MSLLFEADHLASTRSQGNSTCRQPYVGSRGSEVSQELLTLLHVKYGNQSPEGNVPVSPRSYKNQLWRWYEHTHKGQDWIDVPLPPSRPSSPISDASIPKQTHAEDSDRESWKRLNKCEAIKHKGLIGPPNWLYTYVSSFQAWKEESAFLAESLESNFGIGWAIPYDARIGLRLHPWALGIGHLSVDKEKVKSKVEELAAFNRDLHSIDGRVFLVLDYDPWTDSSLKYDFGKLNSVSGDSRDLSGERMMGWATREKSRWDINWRDQGCDVIKSKLFEDSRLQVFRPVVCTNDQRSSSEAPVKYAAPWRRVIVLEGLACLPAKLGNDKKSCPYFESHSNSMTEDDKFGEVIENHLLCKRIPGNHSSNSYEGYCGFHITFFEILNMKWWAQEASQWKIGHLFEEDPNPKNATRCLRHSALTILGVSYSRYGGDDFLPSSDDDSFYALRGLSPLYTILLLAPEGGDFFNRGFRMKLIAQQRTMIASEVQAINMGLSEVVSRWTGLDDYLSRLLVEDFMQPKQYSKLLFDDENFTRSRKYFWAIGCLNEFITSVGDNIKQWDLYYEARVKPLVDRPDLADLLDSACLVEAPEISTYENGLNEAKEFKELVKRIWNHRESLLTIQNQFKTKLETVKSLRDGLFNASALVESRASTRLGENIKMLTYVSIFYLPLAFCATLYSIPNLSTSSTSISFTITCLIIALTTYILVFNLNSLTSKVYSAYISRRGHLIAEMREDKESWRLIGARFEEFKPTSERKVPTEWWILVYLMRRLFRWGGDGGENKMGEV